MKAVDKLAAALNWSAHEVDVVLLRPGEIHTDVVRW